jgi:phytoene dehydrogenase-like protein
MTGRAVVVGSGPNGLAAAIELARGGVEVTVLEAAERPGGAVATQELTLPGFRHDVFSAVYPAAVASPVFARWPLEAHGLRWIHPRHCYAHPLPEGRAAVLSRDVGETAASLDALHPGDGAAWTAFARPYLEHFGAWRELMLAGFPPVRGTLRTLAVHGLAGTLDVAKLLLMPASALAGRLFEHDGARAWLYGSAMHGDVPPSGAGSAIAATHLNLMGHAVGWPSPAGGADRLAGRAHGLPGGARRPGRTGAPVTRVLSRRGRVAGVEVAGSEQLPARTVRGRRVAGRAAAARGRRARRPLRAPPARVPRRPGHAEGRLGAGRADPLGGARGAGGGTVHVAAARTRCSPRWPRTPAACTSGRSCCWASSRSPTRRAPRRAGTRRGRTRTDRTTPTGPARRNGTWSAWRRRSSASRPASAT